MAANTADITSVADTDYLYGIAAAAGATDALIPVSVLKAFLNADMGKLVGSIASLRSLAVAAVVSSIFVTGFAQAGDGGGGPYYRVTGDTSALVDNGGTLIKDGSGNFWKLGGVMPVSPKVFGAKGDGVTDDSNSLQAWFDWLLAGQVVASMRSGYWDAGVYLTTKTIVLTAGFYLPNLFTAGAQAVRLKSSATVAMSLRGGSGNVSNVEWQGITVDGITAALDVVDGSGNVTTPGNEGVRVDGFGYMEWRSVEFDNVGYATRLYNLSGGNFTEGMKFRAPLFKPTVKYGMRLSRGAGTDSFRSSGIPGARCQMADGGAALLVDANCLPYMFDIDGMTVWPQGTTGKQSIIQVNSAVNGMSFHGDVSIEGAGGAQVVELFTSAQTLAWKGDPILFGLNVDAQTNFTIGSNVVRGGDISTLSNGASAVGGKLEQRGHIVASTGESVALVGNTSQNNGYFLSVRIDGPNYVYAYLFHVVHDGYGGNQSFVQLSNLKSNNTAGWNAPTFTANANNLIAANPSWTAGTKVVWTICPFTALPN